MSAATTVNLIVNQRASFQVGFFVKQSNGTALNLTGYSVTAKYKDNFQTPDSQAITFTSEVVDATTGEISIALTPTQTTNLQLGKYVYDVAIINSSNNFKTRVVEGKITVSGGVS
jgi:hypothetical protein